MLSRQARRETAKRGEKWESPRSHAPHGNDHTPKTHDHAPGAVSETALPGRRRKVVHDFGRNRASWPAKVGDNIVHVPSVRLQQVPICSQKHAHAPNGNDHMPHRNAHAPKGHDHVSKNRVQTLKEYEKAKKGCKHTSQPSIHTSKGRIRASRSAEQPVDAQLGRVDGALGRVDGRFGRVDAPFGRVDVRVGRVDAPFFRVDGPLGRVDAAFGRVDTRVGFMDKCLNRGPIRLVPFWTAPVLWRFPLGAPKRQRTAAVHRLNRVAEGLVGAGRRGFRMAGRLADRPGTGRHASSRVRADSRPGCRTGWKPVCRDRRDVCLPRAAGDRTGVYFFLRSRMNQQPN